MKKVLVAVILISLMTVMSYAEDVQSLFKEVDTTFKLNGKPIHPGVVQEFSTWLSDSSIPTTVSVDILAPNDNEYNEDEVSVNEDNYVGIPASEWRDNCSYKWLGRLKNGLHVLEVAEGGSGGSGVFEDLFFVKFEIGEGIDRDSQKYDRLIMTIVRTYILGDRDDGEIEVFPELNKVIVGKSRYREEPVVLEFK